MEKQPGKHSIRWNIINGIKGCNRVRRIKVRCAAKTNKYHQYLMKVSESNNVFTDIKTSQANSHFNVFLNFVNIKER